MTGVNHGNFIGCCVSRVAAGVILCLGTSCGWTAEEGWKTFANPLDVSYRVLRNGPAYSDFATPADPEIVWHAGAYWLFASKGGGYFTSSDLVTWRWIEKPQVPTEEWAPTVAAVGGKLHYTARGGTVHREVSSAEELRTGWMELAEGKSVMASSAAVFGQQVRNDSRDNRKDK